LLLRAALAFLGVALVVATVRHLSAAPSEGGGLDTSGATERLSAADRKVLQKWTAGDYRALHAISDRLGIPSPNLLALMRSESGLDPAAEYPGGLAKGISQLTDAGRAAAGLSADDFADYQDWPVSAQLPVVERQLRTTLAGKRPDTAGALYAYNFLPSRARARGTAPDTVLGTVEEFEADAGLADAAGNYTPRALSNHLRALGSRRKDGSPTDPRFLAALQALRDAVGEPGLSPVW
jgi:hypothetical protein